jgi:ABC-2 type transport system permease protein
MLMYRTRTVALREFKQQVTQRSFWIRSIAVPILVLIITVVTGGLNAGGGEPTTPSLTHTPEGVYGYVDRPGIIASFPEQVPSGAFSPYPTTDAAAAALERGEIDAYYVIDEAYAEDGIVRRVGESSAMRPPDADQFEWVLLHNLYPEMATGEIARLREPLAGGPSFVSLEPSAGGGGTANPTMPFLVTIAIMVPLFTSGSLLFQSLTQEKSGRVMEILLVSLKPHQLLTGKLLGLGGVTLAQYAIWAAIGGLVIVLTGGTSGMPALSSIQLAPNELLLVVVYALGGFTLYAALMAGVGALSPNMESGKTGIFFLALPMMIPIYLGTAITTAPQGTLATALSLIPFSAPVAMLMRMTTTTVPGWQLTASLSLLALTAAGVIWLMSRLFRVQTLLSGEAFSFKRMWAALKGS